MPSDHFSRQSAAYAAHRPKYPDTLFDWLATQAPSRERAWDCACGSGQATVGVARRFERVEATDLSENQLREAPSLPNVTWRKATAEEGGLDPGSVDLVTVAQALHWFDRPRFWREVRRVLKPGGVVAVWSYGHFTIENTAILGVSRDFYERVVGPYWPPERAIVEAGYDALEFPFDEIEAPRFHLEQTWGLAELVGYFSSWSATARFIQDKGFDPTDAVRDALAPLFAEARVAVCWPLSMRVGRT